MSTMQTIPGSRAWLGNLAVGLLLVVSAWLLLRLQAGPWWPASPGMARWVGAGLATVAYLGVCGWAWHAARWSATSGEYGDSDDAATVLVAHASQTGFAEELATRTAQALRDAGLAVRLLPLSGIDSAHLQRTRRLLIVASTTGEGDPPDPALRFVGAVMGQHDLRLADLHYAVLALGDRTYAHYCAFGQQLDNWLRQAGAVPLFDRIDVDNGELGALRHWQHHLGVISGAPEMPDWAPAPYQDWTLIERRELNPGSAGAAAFHIALQPTAGHTMQWQAGDVAEVGPRQSPAAVQALLNATGLDGNTTVVTEAGQRTTLAAVLAASHLPDVATLDGLDAQAVVAQLQPLPHREYSIASLPDEGSIHLLLRRMLRPDGTPGIGSGWLCNYAPIGGNVQMRVRRNSAFHPPAADRPMILIGNGTGIAGLRAHLQARIAAGAKDTWLLFGERNRDRDFFYGEEISKWQRDGKLQALDLAFSRDGGDPHYVQDALRAQSERLRHWVGRGASIYVCGSLQGMAPGVDTVLREVLGNDAVDAMLADGRYRRDVY